MKSGSVFECTKCGAQAPKWAGQCFECRAYGMLRETQHASQISNLKSQSGFAPAKTLGAQELTRREVSRLATGNAEVDRVLGGGIAAGGVVLLAGEPGIGKSTLVVQIAASIAGSVLYVCGEEAPEQVMARIERLGLHIPRLRFLSEVDVPVLVATMAHERPALIIVDSIQTVLDRRLGGDPGSPSQIRAAAAQIAEAAHLHNVAAILIGHVTKGGALAGPKTLEHVVDVVCTFEGDRAGGFRFLRAPKNRYGGTDEVGIFAMSGAGLVAVENPSAQLVATRQHAPGSVLTCIMEGTRPLLVEVQALVTRTHFGYPQRRASGFELNRLQLLLAVLAKRAGLDLGQSDVALNIVGGLTVREPSADLAVCLAIASATRNRELPPDCVAVGEVGLVGEVRHVGRIDRRVAEASRMGMKKIIGPALSAPLDIPGNISYLAVPNVSEAIARVMS